MEKKTHAVSWEDADKPQDRSLDSLPESWEGVSKENKVSALVSVVQCQIERVRKGTFDLSKAQEIAALCLEAQIELSDFYSDVEAQAKIAKHTAEYIEGDTATSIKKDNEGKRISETELKRLSSCKEEVREARKNTIKAERVYRKWRYIFETLKESHIFFRNITKV